MGKKSKIIPPLFGFKAAKIGLVSRDYNVEYPNGYRDFSHHMPEILAILDKEGCDTALFALYSIIPREGYDLRATLDGYESLKLICIEEFEDSKGGRKAGDYVIYHRTAKGWDEYRFLQAFARVNWLKPEPVEKFASETVPKRVLGNCCIIVCGETNGVKYDKKGGKGIIDPYGVLAAIPPEVEVILNPIHDRMTRFEMERKRRFLSQNKRWLLAVWNRGKTYKSGKPRKEPAEAWAVYYDEFPVTVVIEKNIHGVEITFLDLSLLKK